jgi:hypothetical protein
LLKELKIARVAEVLLVVAADTGGVETVAAEVDTVAEVVVAEATIKEVMVDITGTEIVIKICKASTTEAFFIQHSSLYCNNHFCCL